MYLKKLAELSKSAEGHQQYLTWIQDPVTQLAIGAIRELGRPAEPQSVTAEQVFLVLGKSLGFNGAADLLENPVPNSGQVGMALEASYGAKRPESSPDE